MIPRRLRQNPQVSRGPRIGSPLWEPIIDEVADVDWSKFDMNLLPWQEAALRGIWVRDWSADCADRGET